MQVHDAIEAVAPRQIRKVRWRIAAKMRVSLLKKTVEIGRNEPAPAIGSAGQVHESAVMRQMWPSRNTQRRDYFGLNLRRSKLTNKQREYAVERNRLVKFLSSTGFTVTLLQRYESAGSRVGPAS